VRYLLDTHVLLWLANDADRVAQRVRTELADAAERRVSSASAMEIAMKTRLGKLPGGEGVITGWGRIVRGFLATELPLTAAHMLHAGAMVWPHRDPFDRMLVAQATVEGLVLVTQDRRITAYQGIQTLTW